MRSGVGRRELRAVVMTVQSVAAKPPRLPVTPGSVVGRVLPVPAGACRYRNDGFLLRVSRVREDISLWYAGEWVWIEGEDLGQVEAARRFAPVLVHVSVLAMTDPLTPRRPDRAAGEPTSRPDSGE